MALPPIREGYRSDKTIHFGVIGTFAKWSTQTTILIFCSAVIALCAGAGVSSWYLVERGKVSDLLSSMEAEAANLLLLTSSFVSTYSDIHKSNPGIDVPAVMRANTYKRFNAKYQGDERMVAQMVGVPGKEIVTAPVDPLLERLIIEMSLDGPGDFQMISTVTTVENEKIHRSVFPSVASKESCVSCHNEIQGGKHSWKKGDLMGAHVIDRGISDALANIRAYAVLVGTLAAVLIMLSAGALTLYLRLKKQSENLRNLADHDPLTGCLNRRALLRASGDLHHRGCAAGGLLMMDLDHFKFINDTYGHDVGDQVIQHFVSVVKSIVRSDDIVARIGGEEFVVYLPGSAVALSEHLAQRICEKCAASSYQVGEQSIKVTVSIGMVQMINTHTNIFSDWLAASDRFLYEAKNSGRNQAWHLGPLVAKFHH
jgi:diguanylate cyclase (GGDEF)-like protein